MSETRHFGRTLSRMDPTFKLDFFCSSRFCQRFDGDDGVTSRRFDSIKQLDNESVSDIVLHEHNRHTNTLSFECSNAIQV